jgi:hypothetical protein
MNNLFTSILLASSMVLTGCNGSSGKNDEVVSEVDAAVITNVSISTLNTDGESQISFDHASPITLQARVVDQNSDPVVGSRVNFTSDLGTLSVNAKLTDSDGIAAVTILNSTGELSAGTATATINELSSSTDYEYTNNSIPTITIPPSIDTQLLNNGTATNRFKANENVQVLATLLDSDGNPYANQIVNFTADVGALSISSTLTTSDGVASVLLTGGESIGAGVITASLANNTEINSRINYEIVPADTLIEENVRLGYFDSNNDFVEGEIKLSLADNTLSAGGTLGLSVDLIDSENQRINTPTAISFSSNCVSNGNATVDATVFSIKGSASATFEDIKCAGVSGTEDIIIASVTTNGLTSTANVTIEITGEQLGSIEFLSAEPNSIVLKGSGGQETSILTFVVKSALGNTVAQQEVNFSLDTTVGGIALGRTSGLTNSQGQITTQVLSGTVPTTASVSAQATMTFNGEEVSVQTQSNQLSINTGLPEQASMTVSASILNPEASTVGETSQISVWMADSFNNPVPDGTPANFTTEGGSIESQCITVNGTCSVEWRATEPFLDDHRSTILVTTDGHETFYDTNGNNIFDDADGSPIIDALVSSGASRRAPEASGFIDMSEAWLDNNEDNIKDANETKFFDDNGDGAFSAPDGNFNGPQCEGSSCDSNAKKSTIRKSLVLIMSEANNANFILSSDGTTYKDSLGTTEVQVPPLSDGASRSFNFKFADNAMQTLPAGTDVIVEFEGGILTGESTFNVANTIDSGFKEINFVITNEAEGEPIEATLRVSIQTPNTPKTVYFNQLISLL